MHRILMIVVLLGCLWSCHRQEKGFEQIYAPFLQTSTVWADSMLVEMTLDEKIGQLLFVHSTHSIPTDSLAKWAWQGYLGGWLPEGLSLDEYLRQSDTVQALCRIPLMVGTQQPVALNNNFTDVPHYPLPTTLSAISTEWQHLVILDQYVEQCQTLGIHFSLSPLLNTPDTTLGADEQYATHVNADSRLYWPYKVMNRLQDNGIFSVGAPLKKLFHTQESDAEGVAFRDSMMHPWFNLSQNGLSGLLIDRDLFLSDTNRFRPADYLTGYLQKHASFDGMVFGQPDSTVSAIDLLHSGVGVLILKDTSPLPYIQQIRQAVEIGALSASVINEQARKVLLAKTWLGLDICPPKLDEEIARELLNKDHHVYPIYQLYEHSMTLANNPDSLLPFQYPERMYFKLVSVGEEPVKKFNSTFRKYANYNLYRSVEQTENGRWKALNVNQLKNNTVVLSLVDVELEAAPDSAFIASINELSRHTEVVVVNFGTVLNLRYFDPAVAIVQAHELNPTTQSMAAQLLFGGMSSEGKLPMSLAAHLPAGQGYTYPVSRLKYTLPQEVGIAPHKLVDIDAIVYTAIREGAMPGCQVMIVKEGKVIYDKNFGYQTYDKSQPVRSVHLYDLASVTKVAATSLMAMKAYEDRLFRLDERVGQLLKLDRSPIRNITVRDLCLHRTGLQPFLPITPYLNNRDSLVNGCNKYFCRIKQGNYNIALTDSMYFNHQYVDTLWRDIYQVTPKRKRFLYSDLNFIVLQGALESVSNMDMTTYLDQHFYRPLNLTRTSFNPMKRYSASQIAPTAYDYKWRKRLVRGYVHDESAALLGGVAGNAGLFSNANDMAILFQMLLNKGTYGGRQYLRPATVDLFTANHQKGRGLGFEVKTKSGTGGCAYQAGNGTYGHKGFTGTCVWVDPENELIYIFLSNRVYPNHKNRQLMTDRVRQRVHTVVYRAFNSYQLSPYEQYSEPAIAAWPGNTPNEDG